MRDPIAAQAANPFTDGNGEDLWDAAERRAGAARATRLRAQAAAGGRRLEACLPPRIAPWLLGLIEQGTFKDDNQAVFVMPGLVPLLSGTFFACTGAWH